MNRKHDARASRSLVVLAVVGAVTASHLAVSSAALIGASTTSPAASADSEPPHTPRAESPTVDARTFKAEAWPRSAVGNISPEVLRLALRATECAIRHDAAENPSTLTIIDYSKPSTEPRLWVLDLSSRALLYEELVSHGRGSGGNFATRFSNALDSHQTSVGLFVTERSYVGRNGYSLRLDGLDAGFNDRARERGIVIHGAPYVSAGAAKAQGRLGRSQGCPAVRDMIARELIDRIKGGSLVFAYYPDAKWLKTSRFLGQCGTSGRRGS